MDRLLAEFLAAGCCDSHTVVVNLGGDKFPCLLHGLKWRSWGGDVFACAEVFGGIGVPLQSR